MAVASAVAPVASAVAPVPASAVAPVAASDLEREAESAVAALAAADLQQETAWSVSGQQAMMEAPAAPAASEATMVVEDLEQRLEAVEQGLRPASIGPSSAPGEPTSEKGSS